MTEVKKFTIDSEVVCSDGVCGELTRVVVDPVARTLTHLVVEPVNRQAIGRLVPVELVEETAEGIRLRCTSKEFEALEAAEEARFLPGADGDWGYGQGQLLFQPLYGLGMGGMAMGGTGMGGIGMDGAGVGPKAFAYDRVPLGEVEVRRGEHVHATDGPIGQVQGLVIDPSDHHVTHVLLDEGHLWGKKRIAIPISAVKDVSAGVQLTLTKDQLRDLPPVDLAEPE